MNRIDGMRLRAAALAMIAMLPMAAYADEYRERDYRNSGWYLGVGLGYNEAGDQRFEFAGTSTNPTQPPEPVSLPALANSGTAALNEYDGGMLYQIVVGYSLRNQLRPEFEMAVRQNDAGHVRFPDPGPGPTTDPGNVKLDGTAALFNLWYDLLPSSRLRPYIGAGIGLSRFILNKQPTNQLTSGTFVNAGVGPVVCLAQTCNGPRESDDTVLVYQAGAGIRWELSKSITIALDYRYQKTETASFYGFKDQRETHLDADYDAQSLMLSANYYFALPTSPTAAATPAAVVVTAPATCTDGLDHDGDGAIDSPADPKCSADER